MELNKKENEMNFRNDMTKMINEDLDNCDIYELGKRSKIIADIPEQKNDNIFTRQTKVHEYFDKNFVTCDIARKLSILGFNEKCFGYYKNNELITTDIKYNRIRFTGEIEAPLWQQVIDWFREKYNYNITYNVLKKGNAGEAIKSYIFKGGDIQSNFNILSNRTDFYVAREQAILNAIKRFYN